VFRREVLHLLFGGAVFEASFDRGATWFRLNANRRFPADSEKFEFNELHLRAPKGAANDIAVELSVGNISVII